MTIFFLFHFLCISNYGQYVFFLIVNFLIGISIITKKLGKVGELLSLGNACNWCLKLYLKVFSLTIGIVVHLLI